MSIDLKLVSMKSGEQKWQLITPFHPSLPAKLRALHGAWNAERKAWYLAKDLEKEIRALCLEIFMLDPLATVPVETVSVRVTLDESGIDETLYLFGRPVLRRSGRDSDVRPGEGVSIVAGGFSTAGGSMRNPRIGLPETGTIILVRDVPVQALEQEKISRPEYQFETMAEEKPAQERLGKILTEATELATRLGKLLDQVSKEERIQVLKNIYK